MIIPYEQLKESFGGNCPSEVAVRLRQQGIKFVPGKGGRPVTTLDAINAAIFGTDSPPITPKSTYIEPEQNIIEVD